MRSVASQVQVLILMHPQEEHQAKGTARLLHPALPASRLAVGETFAAQELARLLQEPWCDADARAPRHAPPLYPAHTARCAAPHAHTTAHAGRLA